jgi:hypothetical protein
MWFSRIIVCFREHDIARFDREYAAVTARYSLAARFTPAGSCAKP